MDSILAHRLTPPFMEANFLFITEEPMAPEFSTLLMDHLNSSNHFSVGIETIIN